MCCSHLGVVHKERLFTLSIINEIIDILNKKGRKMSELCVWLGINTSTMANWKTRETDPPAKYIAPICEFLDVSIDFLLTGKEKSSSAELSADEQELLTYYKELDDKYRERLISKAETMAELLSEQRKEREMAVESSRLDSVKSKEKMFLDFYALPVSAGSGVYLHDDDREMLEVDVNEISRKANYVLKVSGDSMEPQFFDGDIVLVCSQPSIDIGDIGVFILNGEGYIKKFGGDCLISLNPKYSDIEITECDNLYIKGLVLGTV